MIAVMASITEILREHLCNCTEKDYRIAHESGVDRATLRRFRKGCRINSDTLDKLADYLELELSPKVQP